MPEPCFDYEACLTACAQGDHQALRALYTQESARLLGVARRIAGDNALAEDIVHDAFIRIWTKAASFDPALGTARGWIFSVTRHLALNFMRNNARLVPINQDHEDASHTPSGFDLHGHSGRIYDCLEQLQPARRDCLLHAYVDGYSHGQIAEKLGTPLGTVKAWIKRSLAALRECMG